MIIRQIYFLSQYRSNARYTMAKRTVCYARMFLERIGYTLQKARQQVNQIVNTAVECVQWLEPEFAVCHATDQQICR